MPVFKYRALDSGGKHVSGSISAATAAEARLELRGSDVHVIAIDASGQNAEERAPREVRRVNARELAAALRQLASLLKAGMALVPALSALVEQQGQTPLGTVFAQLRDAVNAGASLADAMQQHGRVFPDLIINMAAAGEASGCLESVLQRAAQIMEKRVSLTAKVKGALAYPVLMAVVGMGVIVFLLSFVVPSIAKLFVEMNRSLPWPTLTLIRFSHFVQNSLLLWILAAFGAFAGLRLVLASPAGRLWFDRLILRVPLVGGLLLKMSISRFARTLGVLLQSGVPVLEALEIVKRIAGNAYVAEAVENAKESVRQGSGLATPLRKAGIFPPVVVHMVSVGEAAGNVEDGLIETAEIYDSEVDAAVSTMTSLLEPLMIITMGAAVGFIVLAILLPIFEINQAIN